MNMAFRITLAIIGLGLASVPALAQTADDFPGEHAAALDKNGDGVITVDEIDVFAETLYPAIDKDQNGVLDKPELLVVLTEDQFTAMDTDKNGTVSLDELKAVVRADFAAADLDQNGKLN